ncbi:MAG: hypothetical protein EBR34_10300 [Sphingomonadaceae bacterium]|nr:hypothetical protein [Sphingomonadaceae bacterium]
MATVAPTEARLMALDRLFASLETAALRLAEARTADRALAARDPARRWRAARLVWPLFTKGSP